MDRRSFLAAAAASLAAGKAIEAKGPTGPIGPYGPTGLTDGPGPTGPELVEIVCMAGFGTGFTIKILPGDTGVFEKNGYRYVPGFDYKLMMGPYEGPSDPDFSIWKHAVMEPPADGMPASPGRVLLDI